MLLKNHDLWKTDFQEMNTSNPYMGKNVKKIKAQKLESRKSSRLRLLACCHDSRFLPLRIPGWRHSGADAPNVPLFMSTPTPRDGAGGFCRCAGRRSGTAGAAGTGRLSWGRRSSSQTPAALRLKPLGSGRKQKRQKWLYSVLPY